MAKGKRSQSPSSSIQLISSGNDNFYEVEEILDKRKNTSGTLYLIKWKNYPDPKDFTWEPKQHLAQVKDLVTEFQKNYEAKRANKSQPKPAQYQPTLTIEKVEKVEKKEKPEPTEISERIQKQKNERKSKKQKRYSSSESEMQNQQAQNAQQKRRRRKKEKKNKKKAGYERSRSSSEEKMNSLQKKNSTGKDRKETDRRRNRSRQRQIESRKNGENQRDKLKSMMRERLFQQKTNLKLGRVCKHYYIDGTTFFNVNILNEYDRVVNFATISLAELKAFNENLLLSYLQQYYQNCLRVEAFRQTDQYLNFQKHWKNIS